MFSRGRWIGSGVHLMGALIALLAFAMATPVREAQAQMSTDAYATKYFLDEPPTVNDLKSLPANARDVIVAKVRIIARPRYLIERDQPGQALPLPNDLFVAVVDVFDLLKGDAAAAGQHEMYFGEGRVRARYLFPHTKERRARDYFVVSYAMQDGVRRLLAFAASKDEFEGWEREFLEYGIGKPSPNACLALVNGIDRFMEIASVKAEAAAKVTELRNRGESLHKTGQHPGCLYPLIEAVLSLSG